MEDALFIGTRYFELEDSNTHEVRRGYSVYLAQKLKGDKDTGFYPVTYYNRWQGSQKFPSVSVDFYQEKMLGAFTFGDKVKVVFDRNNHIIELIPGEG